MISVSAKGPPRTRRKSNSGVATEMSGCAAPGAAWPASRDRAMLGSKATSHALPM